MCLPNLKILDLGKLPGKALQNWMRFMVLKKYVKVTSILGVSVLQLARGNAVWNMCFHPLDKNMLIMLSKKFGFSGNLICTGKYILTALKW